jgi:hypothetical protein
MGKLNLNIFVCDVIEIFIGTALFFLGNMKYFHWWNSIFGDWSWFDVIWSFLIIALKTDFSKKKKTFCLPISVKHIVYIIIIYIYYIWSLFAYRKLYNFIFHQFSLAYIFDFTLRWTKIHFKGLKLILRCVDVLCLWVELTL